VLSEIDVSIPVFILHWNCPEECLKTLQCFLDQDLPLEISVIDNASNPNQLQILKQHLPANVKLVLLSENKGWGGGFNIVLSEWLVANTKSPYCFVSAHDAIPQDNCLQILVESMENDPKLGIVCPEYGDAMLPKFSPLRCSYFIPTKPQSPGTVEAVDIPHGTLTLYRKQCLAEIGIFDERYFAYGDEYDLGLRAQRYNWKVGMVWGAVVINPGSWTPSPIKHYLISRNSLLLAQVYGGWLQGILRAFLMLINSVKIVLLPSIFSTEKSVLIQIFWARLKAI
jgi:GT2 family glycosyltransferase